MFHAGFMAFSGAKREALRALAVACFTVIACASAPALADAPRIASINVCTDQLLLELADPEQILGLSPYSRDAARSWDATSAARHPRLSGEAEDVLMLRPDIVVAGRFTKRATRELLKQKGLRVIEFDTARTIDDVKKQITTMAALVGHPARATASIARIDAAIARTQEIAQRKRYRVLALSRRGWVSGDTSLTTSLLAAVGLGNAAGELGFRTGGFASLESIVSLRPDFLLVSNASSFAEDAGRAFLLHPALEKFYPPSRRIVLPERLTVCGGPMLADALDHLSAELDRVGR